MGKVLHQEDWQPWHDEINRYAKRPTEGLTRDTEELEAHINQLWEVAPKDDAGYPTTTALIYIKKLRQSLNSTRSYLQWVSGPGGL